MLEGNVKDIDPELLMDEQCDSMPYDKRWEFPRYRLKLGWFNRIYSFAYDVTSMFFFASPVQEFNWELDVSVESSKLKPLESKVLAKLSKQWPSKWSDQQQTSPQWKLL